MSIITWGLEIGDSVKIYQGYYSEDYKIYKIKEGPDEARHLNTLMILLEGYVIAIFHEEKQRWSETAFTDYRSLKEY